MKVSVEIDGDKMKYSYEVGGSRRAGDMPLCEDSLLIFTSILEYLNKITMNWKTERNKAFDAYTFSIANPDLIKDVEDKYKMKFSAK